MMHSWRASLAGGAALVTAAAFAMAEPPPVPVGHEGHAAHGAGAAVKEVPIRGERKTIVGEVIDPACYIEAGAKSIGPGHFQCAVDCAKSGQTLAIYDRANDLIYFLAGEYPGKNPNDPVMRFIHKKVDVTGFVYHRSGAWGIVIDSVAVHRESSSSKPAADGAREAQGTTAPKAADKAASK